MQKLLRVLKRKAKLKPNNGFQTEVTKLSLSNRKVVKVGEFITVCKLYLKMIMRKMIV